jgi:alkanesulfonate monooxygenase SsuD/methylene tetrahydromethanopterin reductase-like flavin-dependent oxidoreductase (luciferase family)
MITTIGAGLDARLGLPFPELREAGRQAAGLGFESLWTPAGGVPDAFHVCAAWGMDTGLRTGISVVPAARMWTPMALAVQAATVAQLSGGEFVLGMGTGGGPIDRPVGVMRDFGVQVRTLLDGFDAPRVPVYLATLGRQMLRLAGQVADGAALNWATPARIAEARNVIAAGAAKAGRDAADVAVSMYIRVCVDDDVAAARRALGAQTLSYAMARKGAPKTGSYRGMFGEMGYDQLLSELEDRRDAGAPMEELIDAAPDDLLLSNGYYGPAAGAAEAYARLSAGLDETIVRVVTARPGLAPVLEALEALTPSKIRAATRD